MSSKNDLVMPSPQKISAARKANEQLQFQLDNIRKETLAFNHKQATLAINIWKSAMKQMEKDMRSSNEKIDTSDCYKNMSIAIKAGEHFVGSLYKSMVAISNANYSEELSTRLTWTGSKVELIELGYALQYAKLVNGGHSQLCQIMELLENAFHIDLGNYPRTFQEIIDRKSGSSKVAQKLGDALLSHVNKSLEKSASHKGRESARVRY